MITEVAAALSSLKAASDIGRGLLTAAATQEVQAQVMAMNGAIIEAQAKTIGVQADSERRSKQIADLEAELQGLKDQQAIIATMTRRAPFYYLSNDPDPFCPRCVEKDARMSHMVNTARTEGRIRVWLCPSCKSKLIGSPEPYAPSSAPILRM